MNKKNILFLLMVILSLTAYADEQDLIINGETVGQIDVKRITFDGDMVIFTLSNDSQRTETLGSNTEISLVFDETTNIADIQAFRLNAIVGNQLNIKGLAGDTNLAVYDATGKLMASTRSNGSEATIDISHFRKGVYVLQAGNQVVKFVKQ
ncbi:MAG: T9SS type A sorting domain-containing protein [Prevotella sp.]|nr:T9SS type A sorting domain-containing protein [Prevotella sp.]